MKTEQISSEHNYNSPAGAQIFEVGKPFPWKKYIGRGDMTIAVFNAASFDVVVSFVSPTPEEVKLFRQGNLKMGLFVYKNAPFLYFNFGQYSVDVSLNINKLSDTQMGSWLNAKENVINLYLIDGRTGILRAQRMLGINFMEDIRDTLKVQTQQTRGEVDRLIADATSKYTTAYMEDRAIKSMIFRR